MASQADIMWYLADHPDATVTEVAFRFGISVQKARVLMADVPYPDEEERPPVVIPAAAPDESDDAEWLAELFRSGRVMDIYGAADRLGISHGSVEAAINRGRLSCVQVGAKKLIAKADLDDYDERRKTGRSGTGVVIEV